MILRTSSNTYGSESAIIRETTEVSLTKSIREAGAIVLKICYGYTIEPHSRDPLVDLADMAMEDFGYALLPSTWVVDFIPFCKKLTYLAFFAKRNLKINISTSEVHAFLVAGYGLYKDRSSL